MGQNRPPLEFLISSSNNSLESFELSRLNQAANLRKELRQLVDEWVESEVEGRIARWILESRRAENGAGLSTMPTSVEPVSGQQLCLTFASRFLHAPPNEKLSESSSEERKLPSLSACNDPLGDTCGPDYQARLVAPPSDAAPPPQSPLPEDAPEHPAKLRLPADPQCPREAADRENVHPSFQSCGNPCAEAGANFQLLFDGDSKRNLADLNLQDGETLSNSDSTASVAQRNRKRKRERNILVQHRRADVSAPPDSFSDRPQLEMRPGQQIHAPAQSTVSCGGLLAQAF